MWLGNEEFVRLYEKTLDDAGYDCFKLARTNNRGDGMVLSSDWFFFYQSSLFFVFLILILQFSSVSKFLKYTWLDLSN